MMTALDIKEGLEQKLSDLKKKGIDQNICFYFLAEGCRQCKSHKKPGYDYGCGFGDFMSVREAVARNEQNYDVLKKYSQGE